ncbi:hypothetical protein [Jonesia quinghaiensis]|uniref:hypothetical protein n=1 Tax=Jonesia quinghaiensis TaxID=262806 RepID=UPI0004264DD5|nr:hypothetical protein [Jonesia quinghaiensis]
MSTQEPFEVFSAEEAPDMVPLDGRDGQPVEEGGQDDPRTLDAHDPLKDPISQLDQAGLTLDDDSALLTKDDFVNPEAPEPEDV